MKPTGRDIPPRAPARTLRPPRSHAESPRPAHGIGRDRDPHVAMNENAAVGTASAICSPREVEKLFSAVSSQDNVLIDSSTPATKGTRETPGSQSMVDDFALAAVAASWQHPDRPMCPIRSRNAQNGRAGRLRTHRARANEVEGRCRASHAPWAWKRPSSHVSDSVRGRHAPRTCWGMDGSHQATGAESRER